MLHVVCFGNLWQGDDGFGIHVFRRLCSMPLPSQVRVFDAGTAGFSALGYFENCSKVVIVDAMKSGGRVGSVRIYPFPDSGLPEPGFSVHAFGVDHLLSVLPIVFEDRPMPEVVVIGAEICRINPFTDKLTSQLEAAVEMVIDLIRVECSN